MSDEAQQMTSNESFDEQWIAETILGICSALLSLIGSSTIVLKILRDLVRNGTTTPYDRFILGLSISDIFSSIIIAIDQFFSPSETSLYVWAAGSPTTCQIAGFLVQLSVPWAWWYNGLLSYFFLLTVISQVKREDYVRKFEPWLHLSGLYCLITAIVGYRRGWYNELELTMYCWITDPTIKYIFAGIPIIFAYLSLIINHVAIYIIVQKSLRSSEHVVATTSVQKQLKREAATIMFMYVGSFIVTTITNIILQIMISHFGYTNKDLGKMQPLLILNSTLMPIQGFFNFFIYIKPAYTRFRAANPNKPTYFVLHQALFNPTIPQLYFPSDLSSNAMAEKSESLFDLDFDESVEEEELDPNDKEDSEEIEQSDVSSSSDSST